MQKTKSQMVFAIFNTFILSITAMVCLLPFINIISISLSENSAVAANLVKLWPVKFTLYGYEFILSNKSFWRSFGVTIQRVLIGGTLNMFLLITAAYPLSKEKNKFSFRTAYVWYFFLTMLFSGGLIPVYANIQRLGLINTIWAITLPRALNVFHLVLMLSFFRQIPSELEDAAFIDGASYFRALWNVYVPCSLPAIATIGLFSIVFHWNAWFDGLIYMNDMQKYPLQSYLQTVIIGMDFSSANFEVDDYTKLALLSNRTLRASQIIIAVIPILVIYPYLQRYFVKGIVLGSVKG